MLLLLQMLLVPALLLLLAQVVVLRQLPVHLLLAFAAQLLASPLPALVLLLLLLLLLVLVWTLVLLPQVAALAAVLLPAAHLIAAHLLLALLILNPAFVVTPQSQPLVLLLLLPVSQEARALPLLQGCVQHAVSQLLAVWRHLLFPALQLQPLVQELQVLQLANL
jgi:hypothetical protein